MPLGPLRGAQKALCHQRHDSSFFSGRTALSSPLKLVRCRQEWYLQGQGWLPGWGAQQAQRLRRPRRGRGQAPRRTRGPSLGPVRWRPSWQARARPHRPAGPVHLQTAGLACQSFAQVWPRCRCAVQGLQHTRTADQHMPWVCKGTCFAGSGAHALMLLLLIKRAVAIGCAHHWLRPDTHY